VTRLVSLIQYAGYVALALTAWNAVFGAVKRRDARRLDILLLVAALVLVSVPSELLRRGLAVVPTVILLLVPYLHIRLIQHFRNVSPLLNGTALLAPIVGGILSSTAPLPWPPWQQYAFSTYLIGAWILAALAYSAESKRSSGVTRRRLWFAALGTGAICAVQVVSLMATRSWIEGDTGGHLNIAVSSIALICYYLAFATPRSLRRLWQRTELGRYLVASADREAEDRGIHAADDLLTAAQRGAAGSAVFVAIQDTLTSDHVIVGTDGSHP
jgi:hypothetical protein